MLNRTKYEAENKTSQNEWSWLTMIQIIKNKDTSQLLMVDCSIQ